MLYGVLNDCFYYPVCWTNLSNVLEVTILKAGKEGTVPFCDCVGRSVNNNRANKI